MAKKNNNEHSEERVYMTEYEASAITGMSVSWLRNQRYRNEAPPYVKLGNGKRGAVRYHKDDLHSFMRSRGVTPSR